ncbi:MAG: hypothetical protein ACFB5Z_06900 [Elainellaceae cyanobacterium]
MTYSAESIHSASDSRSRYRHRLNSWAVIRLLPNMQRSVLNRFRTRSDADGHTTFLRHHIPQGEFQVIFDPQTDALEALD